MKNTIYIDIDTEREKQVLIGKGQETTIPTTPEEAKEMIAVDIACICEGLYELISVAGQNGYGSQQAFALAAIDKLTPLTVVDEKPENNEKV